MLWVEQFRPELRSKVLVWKVVTIYLLMKRPRSFFKIICIVIVLARRQGVPVPLRVGKFSRNNRSVCRYRIGAPMDKNAKACLGKPVRGWAFVKRFPLGLIALGKSGCTANTKDREI